MDINTIKYGSLEDILYDLAHRIKQRRLELNLTQKEFSKRIGIGYDAYRNLEMTGDTSLKNIVLVSFLLDDVETIKQLFTKRNYQSIEEVMKATQIKKRERASRNK